MSRTRLVLGFLPLLDCAPLAVAADMGFAADQGLELELIRENSWANIRDRLIVGQFHAAHMLGPMTIASTLGIGHMKVPMVAPMALGLGGNAITASRALWQAMQNHGACAGAPPLAQGKALKEVVCERALGGEPPLTLAMVYPFSSHNYELRYWLAACGIDPDNDVLLIVIPPPLMVDALRSGQIDGFCSGEPWNSLAVAGGVGRIVTTTAEVWRRAPEKVLGMRADWADAHPADTAALVRALYLASLWCGRQDSRSELAALLAQPRFLGVPVDTLTRGLSGRLNLAPEPPAPAPATSVPITSRAPTSGATTSDPNFLPVNEFLVYADHWATFPWTSHALWFYSQMVRWRQVAHSPAAAAAAAATYRPDVFRASLQPLGVHLPSLDSKTEQSNDTHDPNSRGDSARGFFDGGVFDPAQLDAYINAKLAVP